MKGKVVACCISDRKGISKWEIPEIELMENYGVKGDAHSGGERQVSILALESVVESGMNVPPGAFGENILTHGINLKNLKIGDKLIVGEAELEITHIGKKCHTRCAIYYRAGKCIMPVSGVFAKVTKGGKVRKGDEVIVLKADE